MPARGGGIKTHEGWSEIFKKQVHLMDSAKTGSSSSSGAGGVVRHPLKGWGEYNQHFFDIGRPTSVSVLQYTKPCNIMTKAEMEDKYPCVPGSSQAWKPGERYKDLAFQYYRYSSDINDHPDADGCQSVKRMDGIPFIIAPTPAVSEAKFILSRSGNLSMWNKVGVDTYRCDAYVFGFGYEAEVEFGSGPEFVTERGERMRKAFFYPMSMSRTDFHREHLTKETMNRGVPIPNAVITHIPRNPRNTVHARLVVDGDIFVELNGHRDSVLVKGGIPYRDFTPSSSAPFYTVSNAQLRSLRFVFNSVTACVEVWREEKTNDKTKDGQPIMDLTHLATFSGFYTSDKTRMVTIRSEGYFEGDLKPYNLYFNIFACRDVDLKWKGVERERHLSNDLNLQFMVEETRVHDEMDPPTYKILNPVAKATGAKATYPTTKRETAADDVHDGAAGPKRVKFAQPEAVQVAVKEEKLEEKLDVVVQDSQAPESPEQESQYRD
mmetsp:Transcript_2185/g.5743  ORF Transcript_2185/g.5743 Transcript_2185/m.5743 type:complete len:492 (+) Transcript_2185:785-2260(+)